ncbi:hypothetical protein AY599_04775 [Leptolyngbya valderiana BDU 20041]|nr:hypothetical protein AY599_04775 [Leptolyngbya valderiana BDU 20041]
MTEEAWHALRMPIGRFDRLALIDETPSTQGEARMRAQGRSGLVVIGKRQTAGRGRQGRTWDDGQGASLSMSMCVESALPVAGLSLAVGFGVLEACESLGARDLGLKWPNDVVQRGTGMRKLAGVLIEGALPLAIVGVGLNVCRPPEGWLIAGDRPAASLEELGVTIGRPATAAAVLQAVSRWLEASEEAIARKWREVGVLRGEYCEFRVGSKLVGGTVVDIDSQWRLVLETREGNRLRVDSSHAHLEEHRAVQG